VIDIAFPTWFGFAPLGCRTGTSLPFRSRGDVFRPTKEKIDGSAGGFKADQLSTRQKKSSGL
jgi:hypothetical protein